MGARSPVRRAGWAVALAAWLALAAGAPEAVDALPRGLLWGAIGALGAGAALLALPGPAARPPRGAAPPPPSPLAVLAAQIRAAERSSTARAQVVARLRAVAETLGAPAEELAGLESGPGFRARLARALDRLERRAGGGSP